MGAVAHLRSIGRRRSARRLAGTTIVEVLITFALLLAAGGALAQLLAISARQTRIAERRAFATDVAANWLERASLTSFDELTEASLTADQPSDPSLELLPDAKLIGAVAEVPSDDQSLAVKQVKVTVQWSAADGATREQVQLVTWRHQAMEPQP